MNILVAGGAGYIGSVVTKLLVEAGHRVFVFDNLSKGHRDAVPKEAWFLYGDLSHIDDVRGALDVAQAEAVFHFAALIEAGESMKLPAKYFRANVSNTLNLLDACVQDDVKHFVFSSTAAVFAASDQPLSETSRIEPANCYGETKLMVEQELRWFSRVHGLNYAVLRYFNACGAWQGLGERHDPETHLIPLTLLAAKGKRPDIGIFGTDYDTPDGTCIRDYIHVYDLATAHLLALDYLNGKAAAGTAAITCNLGNGAGYSVRQVIDAAKRVTGVNIPVVEAARRPGDAARLVAASGLARSALGWSPRFTALDEIIASAWEFMAG